MHKPIPKTYSYWEKLYFEKTDWLVIGAGLVGLQCAIEIKNEFPRKRVVVIDQGAQGSAASLKNAGFACFGSAGELLDEIQRSGKEAALDLYLKRYYGIQRLMEKFGADTIGFEPNGGYEVFTESEKDKLELILAQLSNLNRELQEGLQFSHLVGKLKQGGKESNLNSPIFDCVNVSDLGMNVCSTAIFAKSEGPIQTHRLYRSVRAMAMEVGVEVCEGYRVGSFEETVGEVSVYTDLGEVIKTQHLLVCTNGFTRDFDTSVAVVPARGQVFVTEPLPWSPLRGIYHADDGYIYFRNVGDRILIGGGRNMDMVSEETTEMSTNIKIREYLRNYLQEVVLPRRTSDKDISFDYEWSGIMGMGPQRTPIVSSESNRVYRAVRMGGMGVALSAWVAEEMVSIIKRNHG